MDILQQFKAKANNTRIRHPADKEHQLQCACVKWFRYQHPNLTHNLFAIPNGGRRDAVTGAKLKAEGVLPGVADIILLKQNSQYGALLIEMKTPTGKQSKAQKQWQQNIQKDQYKYVICRTLNDFINEVNNYLEL